MAADLAKQTQDALEEMRPYLERGGTAVRLLGVEDGVAHVVVTTPETRGILSILTMVAGIERALRQKIPELRGVAPVNVPPYSSVGWDRPDFAERLIRLEPGREQAA